MKEHVRVFSSMFSVGLSPNMGFDDNRNIEDHPDFGVTSVFLHLHKQEKRTTMRDLKFKVQVHY